MPAVVRVDAPRGCAHQSERTARAGLEQYAFNEAETVQYEVSLVDTQGDAHTCSHWSAGLDATSGPANEVFCYVPSIEPGRYSVRIHTTDGFAATHGHDIVVLAQIVSIEPPVGSIAGGQDVQVTVRGARIDDFYARINVAGVPCEIRDFSNDNDHGLSTLTCRTGSSIGAMPTTVRHPPCGE